MKKFLLLSGLFAVTGSYAQNYFSLAKSKGIDVAVYDYKTTLSAGTKVLQATNDDVLSAAQTLPFTWSFYGVPVTSYKICDNGYITFDAAATTAMKPAVALPSTSAPKSAIFAMWADFKLASGSGIADQVGSWTYGTAPNRVHVIQWLSVTTSSGSFASFAIRIYEGGGFDVVHNQLGTGATVTGSIGTNNADGTVGYALGGAPATPMTAPANDYDNANMEVYRFMMGPQPSVWLKMTKNYTPSIVSLTSPTADIKVQVTNWGSSAISSAKFNYMIDGGTVKTQIKSPFDVAASGADFIDVTHSMKFTAVAGDAGTLKDVKVWFSEVNVSGGNSDTLNFKILVNKGLSGTKRVLLEEGSGAWCGFCPDGHVTMRNILDANHNVGGQFYKVIGVVHHNSDGMTNAESDKINSAYAPGYPFAMADRVPASGATSVDLGARSTWSSKATARLSASTPVNVSIVNKSFNAATRQISFDVKVDFVDAAYGDIRVSAMVVEDKVRGPITTSPNTTQWTQHSYYSKFYSSPVDPSHELYNSPEYFYGYFHNHVVKAVLPDAWGDATVVPSLAPESGSYTKTFTWTLPAQVDANPAVDYPGQQNIWTPYQSTQAGPARNKASDIYLIGIVSLYNADKLKREVLNVNQTPLLWATGNEETPAQDLNSAVYPNPVQGLARVDFQLKNTSNVDIAVYDITGKRVMDVKNGGFAAGEHMIYFDSGALNNGIYFISITTEEGSATHKIVVNN